METSTTIRRPREQPQQWLRDLKEIMYTPDVCIFCRHVAARLTLDGFVLPDWYNDRYWHEFIFDMHKEPDAFEELKKEFFEADAPYLKSATFRDHSTVFFGMYVHNITGAPVSTMEMAFAKLQQEEIAKYPESYQEFLGKAIERAKTKFVPLQKWKW